MASNELNKKIGDLFKRNERLEKKMEQEKDPGEMIKIQIEARQNSKEIRDFLLNHPDVGEEIKASIRESGL